MGSGQQASVVWSGGAVIHGPTIDPVEGTDVPLRKAAINQALRVMGIEKAADAIDEFHTVELGRHRRPKRWLEP